MKIQTASEIIKAKAKEFDIEIGEITAHQLYQTRLIDCQFSGCYLVFDSESCLYIGSAKNIRRRVSVHFVILPEGRLWSCSGARLHTCQMAPVESEILVVPCDDAKMLERLLIVTFKPDCNKKHNGGDETKWRFRFKKHLHHLK